MIGSVLTSHKQILKGNPVSTLVLQSPDLSKWVFQVTENGELRGYSGAAGTLTDVKVSGGSDVSGEAGFAVTNNGELVVENGVDLSSTATLDDNFRMRSVDGSSIYKLTVSSDDEIVLEEV